MIRCVWYASFVVGLIFSTAGHAADARREALNACNKQVQEAKVPSAQFGPAMKACLSGRGVGNAPAVTTAASAASVAPAVVEVKTDEGNAQPHVLPGKARSTP